MTNTKNQKRMEKLSKITSSIRKLHHEIRQSDLTRTELVGLGSELCDLVVAADALQGECTYRPVSWAAKDCDTLLHSLPGHAEHQKG